MAFTGKKRSRRLMPVFALTLMAAAPVLAEVRFEITHDHLYKGCRGIMTVDDQGIAFRGAKNHAWRWKYEDIQELKLSPEGIHLTTYWDSAWRLGADRQYEFHGEVPATVYEIWRSRLDQRFVARLADEAVQSVWSIPAKHLRRISGSEGMLEVASDRIVYRTPSKDDSRTWRFEDIENVSSSGPFQMTITTYERARMHYGNLKDFNFQLKQRLSESRYNELWRNVLLKNGRIQ